MKGEGPWPSAWQRTPRPNRQDRSILAPQGRLQTQITQENFPPHRSLPCCLDTRRGCGEAGGHRNTSERDSEKAGDFPHGVLLDFGNVSAK
jgi:hypothetical protein